MKKNNLGGFTLVELLVVVTIIGILSSMAIVSFHSARQKARDAKRKGDLRQVSLAIQLYFDDNKDFPPNPLVGQTCVFPNDSNCLKELIDAKYMARLPKDPQNQTTFTYTYYNYGADNIGAVLKTSLETEKGTSQCNLSQSLCNPTTTGDIHYCICIK